MSETMHPNDVDVVGNPNGGTNVLKAVAASASYPRYGTYAGTGRTPAVLLQERPVPSDGVGSKDAAPFYPDDPLLAEHLSSREDRFKMGVARFAAFLEDTVEVEFNVVIPAVAASRRLPVPLPASPELDLYGTVADEGFHAEQALTFLHRLREETGLGPSDGRTGPQFVRRLEAQRLRERDPAIRNLMLVFNGVVTETRISVELGQFARNTTLDDRVRDICRSHASDEDIHSSQFRALGKWLWSVLDDQGRERAARFVAEATINRSLPDLERTARLLSEATGLNADESREAVFSAYTVDDVLDEMMVAAKPTVTYFHRLGAGAYYPFEAALDAERARLEGKFATVLGAMGR